MFCSSYAPRHRALHSFPTRRSSDLHLTEEGLEEAMDWQVLYGGRIGTNLLELKLVEEEQLAHALGKQLGAEVDRKSTRLNSSHGYISYAVFCLKKKTNQHATCCHNA